MSHSLVPAANTGSQSSVRKAAQELEAIENRRLRAYCVAYFRCRFCNSLRLGDGHNSQKGS